MLPWTGLPVPAPATFIVQPSPSLLSVHASNIGSKVVATSAPIPSQLVPGGQATLLNMNQSNMRATPPQTFNAYAHSSALNVSVASVNSRPAMIIPSQPSQMQPHVPVHMSQNICQVPMGLSEMVQMPIGLSLPSQVPEMNNGMPCHSLQPSQQGRLFSVPRKFMPHFHGSPPLLSPPLRKQSMSQSSSHADKSETASVTSSQLSPPFLLVGGIGSTVPFPPSKPSPTASTASKPQKRSLDESDPAVSKCSSKSKKSAKLIHLETKCSSLERENESLQMRLAVLENGSKLFSQREQELLNRVKALECQLGESHRVMLQQLGNSHS
ncbi:hypothetical protein BC830DRAFT_940065 [Chytriomyces sp. MP71]|nr:hypothetical protein BC830DRAFT_940065 [Chytriomyces sp. MP71]